MTDKQTPPEWVLIEAAKRAGLKRSPAQLRSGQIAKAAKPHFHALCDMILKHEQPPVDRKLLCAREAMAEEADATTPGKGQSDKFRSGEYDRAYHVTTAVRAIELWEEGFGA
jgi:hypothetical protein